MSMRDKADAVTCHLNYSPGDATSCAGLLDSLRGTVVSSLSAILYILFRQLRRRKGASTVSGASGDPNPSWLLQQDDVRKMLGTSAAIRKRRNCR